MFFDAASLSVSNNGSPWKGDRQKAATVSGNNPLLLEYPQSTTSIFEADHASAVRLPPEFGFQPGDEVEIIERGGQWIIRKPTQNLLDTSALLTHFDDARFISPISPTGIHHGNPLQPSPP